MIRNTGQDWKIGAVVKVGFMKLRIIGLRAIKDGLPDIYDMESIDGSRQYEFIPHNGLTRVDPPHQAGCHCLKCQGRYQDNVS